jgi:hypothetical protein
MRAGVLDYTRLQLATNLRLNGNPVAILVGIIIKSEIRIVAGICTRGGKFLKFTRCQSVFIE